MVSQARIVEWLETDEASEWNLDHTRIESRVNMVTDGVGMTISFANGILNVATQHIRPMIQLLPTEGVTDDSSHVPKEDACAGCYDMSRSWACDEHPDYVNPAHIKIFNPRDIA